MTSGVRSDDEAGAVDPAVVAVAEVVAATQRLLEGLTTNAPPKDREIEAAKARQRAAKRYAA